MCTDVENGVHLIAGRSISRPRHRIYALIAHHRGCRFDVHSHDEWRWTGCRRALYVLTRRGSRLVCFASCCWSSMGNDSIDTFLCAVPFETRPLQANPYAYRRPARAWLAIRSCGRWHRALRLAGTVRGKQAWRMGRRDLVSSANHLTFTACAPTDARRPGMSS